MTKEKFYNILIIKPSAIGDIITAIPALHELRKAYPKAKISWLVRSEYAGLIESHPDLDGLLIFDRKLLGKFFTRAGLAGIFKFVKKLRSQNYDLVIDMQGLFRTGLFSWLTRSSNRIGSSCAREGATLFYTNKISPPVESIHVVDVYLEMVEFLTQQKSKAVFSLGSNREDERFILDLLKNESVYENDFVVLIPAASVDSKCWPAQNFAEIADYVSQKYEMDVVLIGTESEKDGLDEVVEKASSRVINLAGKTNLSQLIELLRKSKLVVSNDTGPGQIAQASDVATLILFGHTNPKRVGIYAHPERSLCVGINERSREIENQNPAFTIDKLPVEMVVQAIDKVLG